MALKRSLFLSVLPLMLFSSGATARMLKQHRSASPRNILLGACVGDGCNTTPTAPQPAELAVPSARFAQVKRTLAESKALADCKEGETVCGVFGGKRNAYECVDINTDLESCGGCSVLPRFLSPDVASKKGVDCSAIEGVHTVSCQQGLCLVEECNPGYVVSVERDTCVKATGRDTLDPNTVLSGPADSLSSSLASGPEGLDNNNLNHELACITSPSSGSYLSDSFFFAKRGESIGANADIVADTAVNQGVDTQNDPRAAKGQSNVDYTPPFPNGISQDSTRKVANDPAKSGKIITVNNLADASCDEDDVVTNEDPVGETIGSAVHAIGDTILGPASRLGNPPKSIGTSAQSDLDLSDSTTTSVSNDMDGGSVPGSSFLLDSSPREIEPGLLSGVTSPLAISEAFTDPADYTPPSGNSVSMPRPIRNSGVKGLPPAITYGPGPSTPTLPASVSTPAPAESTDNDAIDVLAVSLSTPSGSGTSQGQTSQTIPGVEGYRVNSLASTNTGGRTESVSQMFSLGKSRIPSSVSPGSIGKVKPSVNPHADPSLYSSTSRDSKVYGSFPNSPESPSVLSSPPKSVDRPPELSEVIDSSVSDVKSASPGTQNTVHELAEETSEKAVEVAANAGTAAGESVYEGARASKEVIEGAKEVDASAVVNVGTQADEGQASSLGGQPNVAQGTQIINEPATGTDIDGDVSTEDENGTEIDVPELPSNAQTLPSGLVSSVPPSGDVTENAEIEADAGANTSIRR